MWLTLFCCKISLSNKHSTSLYNNNTANELLWDHNRQLCRLETHQAKVKFDLREKTVRYKFCLQAYRNIQSKFLIIQVINTFRLGRFVTQFIISGFSWRILVYTKSLPLYHPERTPVPINPLNTKRRLLSLKTQFVPHSKHFSSRL